MAERILVTSQYLLEKQGEWKALSGKAWESFLEAVADTQRLSRHFDGKPVSRLQKEFISLGKDAAAAFGRMEVHLGKLGEIGAVYEEAERSNVNVTPNH